MKTDTFSTILFGGLALLLLHGVTRKSDCGCTSGSEELSGIKSMALRPSSWYECRDGRTWICSVSGSSGDVQCTKLSTRCRFSGIILA